MSLLLLFNQPPLHLWLLDHAQELLRASHPENAVVTAMIACEIFTEQVFSAVYQKKGLAHLEEPIEALLTGRTWRIRVRRGRCSLNRVDNGARCVRSLTKADARASFPPKRTPKGTGAESTPGNG